MKLEYKAQRVSKRDYDVTTALNVLGAQGWELVSITESPIAFDCYFKRTLQSDASEKPPRPRDPQPASDFIACGRGLSYIDRDDQAQPDTFLDKLMNYFTRLK